MVEKPQNGVSAGLGATVSGIREVVSRAPRQTADLAGLSNGYPGATPNGPRGRRMLSPATPVESLDRTAPRGTYLDILV